MWFSDWRFWSWAYLLLDLSLNWQIIFNGVFLRLVGSTFVGWTLSLSRTSCIRPRLNDGWASMRTLILMKKRGWGGGRERSTIKDEEDNLFDIQKSTKKILNFEFAINCDGMVIDQWLTMIRQLFLEIRRNNIKGKCERGNLIILSIWS